MIFISRSFNQPDLLITSTRVAIEKYHPSKQSLSFFSWGGEAFHSVNYELKQHTELIQGLNILSGPCSNAEIG